MGSVISRCRSNGEVDPERLEENLRLAGMFDDRAGPVINEVDWEITEPLNVRHWVNEWVQLLTDASFYFSFAFWIARGFFDDTPEADRYVMPLMWLQLVCLIVKIASFCKIEHVQPSSLKMRPRNEHDVLFDMPVSVRAYDISTYASFSLPPILTLLKPFLPENSQSLVVHVASIPVYMNWIYYLISRLKKDDLTSLEKKQVKTLIAAAVSGVIVCAIEAYADEETDNQAAGRLYSEMVVGGLFQVANVIEISGSLWAQIAHCYTVSQVERLPLLG